MMVGDASSIGRALKWMHFPLPLLLFAASRGFGASSDVVDNRWAAYRQPQPPPPPLLALPPGCDECSWLNPGPAVQTAGGPGGAVCRHADDGSVGAGLLFCEYERPRFDDVAALGLDVGDVVRVAHSMLPSPPRLLELLAHCRTDADTYGARQIFGGSVRS